MKHNAIHPRHGVVGRERMAGGVLTPQMLGHVAAILKLERTPTTLKMSSKPGLVLLKLE
jgi:hypothetical protein